MLAKHALDVMLTAADLAEVKQFYRDRVGLDVLIEGDDFVTFRCGGDSRLVVTRATAPNGEQHTKALPPGGGRVRVPRFDPPEQRFQVRHLVIFRPPLTGGTRPATGAADWKVPSYLPLKK